MSPLVCEPSLAEPATDSVVASEKPSLWSDLMVLTKARLTFMVLITTAAGFYLGSVGPVNGAAFFWTLLGTGLVAAAAAVLNQVWERETDRLMERTADRPLVAGRIHPDAALALGVGLTALGVFLLIWQVNEPSAFLAAATLALYVFIYTPMKRWSTLNTAVGAIPGALPPVVGWTAAAGHLDPSSLWLFAVLYFWQMPHFLAIAWMYREDYARAGMRMLPCEDPSGVQTSMQSVIHAVALIPISLMPYFFGQAGLPAFVSGLLLGLGYTAMAVRFFLRRDHASARSLFLASIFYLPLVLLALALFKI
jgi:protoheme IX farnesyltransferase